MSGATVKLDEVSAEILRRAEVVGGVLKLPGEQLDRKLYVSVDKALKAIGGRWDRKVGGHVFTEPDSLVRLEAMLVDGTVQQVDNHGYFPTPPALVDRLLELAEVESHHVVLEPSAGRGAIATRLAELVPLEQLHLVELQPKHAEHLVGFPNITVGDFMETTFNGDFDRVVMNPPFERQQDIDHVTRAFSRLAPGGRLVSIMGAGATQGSRSKNTAFRELVEAHGSTETNPEGSFKEAGTSVRTITVVLNAPASSEGQSDA